MKCCLMQDGIGWRNRDGVIHICVNKEEAVKLISELHLGYCEGHFATHTTTNKIMREGYYRSSIFSHTHQYVRSCQPCQLFSRNQRLPTLSLKSMVFEAPFQQWGLDFIGEFKDKSSNGYRWVLTTTYYFT